MKNFLRISVFFPFLLILFVVAFVACDNKKTEKNEFFSSPIKEINFDVSMGKDTPEFPLIFANASDVDRYKRLKALYEMHLPSKVKNAETPRIPKIIHQIWIGPKSPPSYFATFQEKWKAVHPDWEYCLWTEAELEGLNLDLGECIEESTNWAEKSDMIRCELLDRFGGVYLDVDMDCNHSLEDLHYKYDFYAGIEYPHSIATTENRIWLGISIMASKPGHPVMKRWKELIRSNWDKANKAYSSSVERVINHTYFPFTKAFFDAYREANTVNMVFPATYFYPLSPAHASKRRSTFRKVREKFYDFLESINLRRHRAFSKIHNETLAVHYWGNSWLPGPVDKVQELSTQVDYLRGELYQLQQRLRLVEKQEHDFSKARVSFQEPEKREKNREESTATRATFSFNSVP